ncbi:MAG TPA: XrtA system polysaccharide chain length determinant [Candidatus Polarisedimenticolia bacterium]|nr:XrtA system polysaccharide chain length determinant [Candidatus Polarisedimenticolia bacterium]
MRGQSEQGEGIHRVLEIWGRRWWLGVAVFLGVLVPGLSFVAFLPDMYRATTTVLVERPQVSETFVRPAVTEELETRIHALSEEILSRANLAELLTRFDLYPILRQKASVEDAIMKLRRDIDLDLKGVENGWSRGATVAFVLGYRGRDPRKVAQVVNTLASFYVEENTKVREAQAARTSEFLKSQLAEMKQKLADQENLIGQYKKRHAGELPQQVEANIAGLERLNAQLQLNNEKQIRAMERRDRLAGPSGDAVAGLDPEDDEGRLGRLKQELAALRRQYSAKYPDVVRLEREIAALEDRIAARAEAPGTTGGAVPAGAEAPPASASRRGPDAEIQALKREEERLRQTIAAYEQRVDNAPQRQQEFEALSRDYETTRELYDSLLKKHEESLLAESMEHGRTTEQFRVLDPALPPSAPAAPNRIWLSLMGLIVSVGLAVGAMALAEQLDTSFHTVESLRAFTRVPVLASIPRIVTRGDAFRRGLRIGVAAVGLVMVLAAAAGASCYLAREYEPLVFMMSGGRL